MYKNIVVPIDIDSKNSWNLAIAKSIKFAENFNSKLYFITVVPDYGLSMMQSYFPKGWVNELKKKSKIELSKILEKFISTNIDYEIIVAQGTVYQVIMDQANKIHADLIIMAAHHPNRSDYLLGPITAKVARHSKISILIAREDNN